MRKLMIVAIIAAAGFAAAACADNSPKPSASSTPAATTTTTAATVDETHQVCAEAMAAGSAAAVEFNAKVDQLNQAAQSGDLIKANQLANELRQKAAELQTQLQGWSAKNVKPEVKAALTDGATTVQQLNNPAVMPDASAKTKLQDIATRLSTACAGACPPNFADLGGPLTLWPQRSSKIAEWGPPGWK
jgi:hypothetical protein